MAAPGWPTADTVPESIIVHIDADSSHHGSHHSSLHGSQHGSCHGPGHESQHGATGYIQDLQKSRESNRAAAAKLERRTSRRLDNSGTNDYTKDYAGDYPIEADRQAQADAKTKTHNYDPKLIVVSYFRKWAGGVDDALPVPPVYDMILSFIGAFLGILWVAGCAHALDNQLHEHLLVASLGATAVLLYGQMESKVAQPRNVIGGHVVSAAVGCAFRLALKDALWIAAPVSMAMSQLAMQLTRTVHPPGGATAIIASQASPLPPWAGFSFILVILVASAGQTVIAVVVNNLHTKKRYPTYWFGGKL
ncbi:hypothetical protein WJX77_012192 [Trebouxia sp. C0004]